MIFPLFPKELPVSNFDHAFGPDPLNTTAMAYRDTVHCEPHEGGPSHCVGNRGVIGFRAQGRQLTGIIMLGPIGTPGGSHSPISHYA